MHTVLCTQQSLCQVGIGENIAHVRTQIQFGARNVKGQSIRLKYELEYTSKLQYSAFVFSTSALLFLLYQICICTASIKVRNCGLGPHADQTDEIVRI